MRQYWREIYAPWFAIMLPFVALLYFLLQDHAWIATLILWWLKPVYDRILLHILSRSIFGETLGIREVLSAIPSLLKTGVLAHLTLLRIFDFARSFNIPVWQLEGLRGKARRQRQSVLQLRARSYAVWLLIVCMHFEYILYLGFYVLLWMFTPAYFDFDMWDLIANENQVFWVEILGGMIYFLVITIIEPLYVAAGFTLYLNRRTQLEGWDIELTFRRLAQRLDSLKQATPALLAAPLLALLLVTGAQNTAHAEEQTNSIIPYGEDVAESRLPASESGRVIEQVLEDRSFGTEETVERWRWKEREDTEKNNADADTANPEWDEALESLATTVATLFELLLWVLLAILLILLFVYRDRWLHLFVRRKGLDLDYTPPESLFGLDIREESLPDDVAGDARELWRQGKHRAAMSLLYRGALAALVNRDKITLHDSNTEGDILVLARPVIAQARHDYLGHLTGAWQLIAYAHREPEETRAQELLNGWDRHFGRRGQVNA